MNVEVARTLAYPEPPAKPLGLGRYLRALRDNSISRFHAEAYSAPILEDRVIWRRSFIVNDPEAIRHVAIDNARNYRKPGVFHRILDPGLGQGLLTSEGAVWQRHRRIMAPAFDARRTAAHVPAMAAIAEDWSDRWLSALKAPFDMAEAMTSLALEMITGTLFSNEGAEISAIIERDLGRYQDVVRPGLSDLLDLPEWQKGRRRRAVRGLLREFDDAVAALIRRRRESSANEPNDLLGRLLAARDEHDGVGLSETEIRDQVITTFVAGHETTAMALTWLWYLLALHPDVEAQVQAELEQVLDTRQPTQADFERLPYLRAVIDETFRLYPAAPEISREAVKDDTLCGRHVPKGSVILIAPWIIHRHRALWHEPLVFSPERFLASAKGERSRFAYIPFGIGPRVCIGASFAVTEMLVAVAALARRARFRLVDPCTVSLLGNVTLRPKDGLWMTRET